MTYAGMKSGRKASAIFLALAAIGVLFPGALLAADAPKPGRCHALLISGQPGEEIYTRRYADWLKRFHAYLVAAGVPKENITVLSGDKGFKDAIVSGEATAEAVKKALADAAKKAKGEDQFILFLVGHGVLAEEVPTLALPGPDVSARDLADGLEAIPAENQVVLNFAAGAGAFLKTMTRKGRVNVAATSPIEGNEPAYAEFFLRGLESKRADGEGGPKDGAISVLEAYNWATRETALWISRIRMNEDGTWAVSGKESVEIFEKLYSGPAGKPGVRQLAAGSDRTKPDEAVTIKPEGGKITEDWLTRRVLSEHALLDDTGTKEGQCAIGKEGYLALSAGKEGEPGALAACTVIGKAERLPAK